MISSPYYRVHLSVGPLSWVVEAGDDADYGPTDPLVIGWKYPENAAWPTQPEIPYARFGVVVADAADFNGVDIGSEVAIAVYHRPAGTVLPAGYSDGSGTGAWVPVASFAGRVTDMTAQPHKLGMVYQLDALDYLVEAVEYQVQGADDAGFPAEDIQARLTRIADLATEVFKTVPWSGLGGPEDGWGIFHAKATPDLKGALDHMVEYLSQYVYLGRLTTGNQGGARGVVVANNVLGLYDPANMAPDPARRFDVAWRFRKSFNRGPGNYLPARFRPTGTGGKWRPDVDPADGVNFIDTGFNPTGAAVPAESYPVIPANLVSFDADWSRTKKGRAERVRVESTFVYVDTPTRKVIGANVGVDDYSSDPPPTLVVQSDLGYAEEAGTLARFLLGDAGPADGGSDRWAVRRFRFLADQAPDRVTQANSVSWFHLSSAVASPLRVVSGIPAAQNPNPGGADFYAGILSSAEFTLSRGRYWIDFTLTREVPRPATSNAVATSGFISCASLALDHPAVRHADLDPRYTHLDYRIVRKG